MAFFAPDIAIDLGTCNTSVYVRGRGMVINEPTMVVTDANDRRKVRAVGDEARFLQGRTTAALASVRPMKNGTIEDFDMTQVLLRYFMRKAIGTSHVFRSKVLIAVPCSLPAVARKAVQEAAKVAGAKNVFLIEKPFAAAIGSGLPVHEAVGSMVVDIGGGTTDVAVTSIGGIVVAQSIQVGGDKMDDAVAGYIRREANTVVGAGTVEQVKRDLGDALPPMMNTRVRIRGKDTATTNAKDIEFTSMQCYEALRDPCKAILGAIKWVLERTPPELAADIMRGGIHLTGGGAQLKNLDHYVAEELGMPVLVARDPTNSTITGLGYLVENIDNLGAISRQTATRQQT